MIILLDILGGLAFGAVWLVGLYHTVLFLMGRTKKGE